MEKLYLPEVSELKLVDSDFTAIAVNDSSTEAWSIICNIFFASFIFPLAVTNHLGLSGTKNNKNKNNLNKKRRLTTLNIANYLNIAIYTADSNFKLEVKKFLLIIKEKFSLNKQLNAKSKFNIKTLLMMSVHHNNTLLA